MSVADNRYFSGHIEFWSINNLNITEITQIWLSYASSSEAQLTVVEPALVCIMTHDHVKDLDASELGPLRALYELFDELID